ncbi:SBBP repeat-containing protein, partial [Candidatus Eisenbacteria bacterium]
MRSAIVLLLTCLWLTVALHPAAALTAGFIENRGQLDDVVYYYSTGPYASLYFTAEGIVLAITAPDQSLPGSDTTADPMNPMDHDFTSFPAQSRWAILVRFDGANTAPRLDARAPLTTTYSYFLGCDPDQWRTGIRAYSEIVYRELWPGVDVSFRQDGGSLVYSLDFAAGADTEAALFSYDGAVLVHTEEDGAVLLHTDLGTVVHRHLLHGASCGSLQLLLPDTSGPSDGVSCAGRDNPSSLLWSTFIGASGLDNGRGLALDSADNAIITGTTSSSSFPTTVGAYDTSFNGDYDVFVSKISASGSTLLWSTFVGGNDEDSGTDVVLDGAGNPVITGHTRSTNFPTTPGVFDTSFNGEYDAYVAKLSESGSSLLWSTFLGGDLGDSGHSLLYHAPTGSFILAGAAYSSDFPTTMFAFDTSHNGHIDGFVTKITGTGQFLQWSTFLGGAVTDDVNDIVADPDGNLYLTGRTSSPDFPVTTGAFDTSHNGEYDCFVAKFNSSATTLQWSTFMGSTEWDYGSALAIDDTSNVIVTGLTYSAGFPVTPDSFDPWFDGGPYDCYVAKLSSTGDSLKFGTFLGGTGGEAVTDLILDASSNPIVVGSTGSTDFPTTPGGYATEYAGGSKTDAFVTAISKSGSHLLYGSYLGGSETDGVHAVKLDALGHAVLLGQTQSDTFPTTPGAYDTSHNGYGDTFVAKLSMKSPKPVMIPEPQYTPGTNNTVYWSDESASGASG